MTPLEADNFEAVTFTASGENKMIMSALVLSLATNVAATSLIAWKAW